MEFFRNAQNFTMGNVDFKTVEGNYQDYRTRNVRNVYRNQNTYYTDNNDQYYDHSTNYNGDYYATATHYHTSVNNVQRGQIVTGNVNGGNFYKPKMGDYNNQGPVAQSEGGPTPTAAPAGPSYDQYHPPPPRRRPGPPPGPYDQDFTVSEPAAPRYLSQQWGPPRPSLRHHSHTGPDDHQGWGQHQQGPPPAFPPRGPQGYPQHPPLNPNYRPSGAPFPPRQQRQPPPQQQQWQGPERWPGQYAYERGMAHLKQNSPASWDTNSSGDSDTSDEEGSGEDEEPVGNVQRMKDPDRSDHALTNRDLSQPSPDQFAPQRQQGRTPPPAPPVAAYDDHQDDAGINDLLSSLSLGKKRKKEPRNHFASLSFKKYSS